MKKTMLAAAWLLFSVIAQAGNGKNGNLPQSAVGLEGERGVERVAAESPEGRRMRASCPYAATR